MLRMVEQSGASTVFAASNEALSQFQGLELGRIYTLKTISPRCIRKASDVKKWGVMALYEVTLKYPVAKEVASQQWKPSAACAFLPFGALDQCGEGDVVDIVGKVLQEPCVDQSSQLAKLILVLGAGALSQRVELLGQHASQCFVVGDVVVCVGLRVEVYRGCRSLCTMLLSVVERNPDPRQGQPDVAMVEDGQPVRKAMRISTSSAVLVTAAKTALAKLVAEAKSSGEDQKCEMALLVKLPELGQAFFEHDPPLVGDERQERICWKAVVSDETGALEVKIWEDAAREVFGVSGEGLRALWSEGEADVGRREDILATLNAQQGRDAYCVCSCATPRVACCSCAYSMDLSSAPRSLASASPSAASSP